MSHLLTSFVFWSSLEEELGEKTLFLEGDVLNAGCGFRIINLPNAKKIVGFDMIKTNQTDVVGDIESMPFPDESFDGILNIAVLEHVKHPWEAIREFRRVLKKDGKLLCVVPFMQPIHLYPRDYYRFTPEGIKTLLEDNGFEVLESSYGHSIFHILGWYAEDGLKNCNFFLQLLFWPFGRIGYFLSKYFPNLNISTAPSVVTVMAIRKT